MPLECLLTLKSCTISFCHSGGIYRHKVQKENVAFGCRVLLLLLLCPHRSWCCRWSTWKHKKQNVKKNGAAEIAICVNHWSCAALFRWLVSWLPACILHTCTVSADVVSLSLPTASRCSVTQLADYRAAPGRYCSSLSQFYIVNGAWTMKLYTNYDYPPVAQAVTHVLWISQHRAGGSMDKQLVRWQGSVCFYLLVADLSRW